MKDIVLITIDCWRSDALPRMRKTIDLKNGFTSTTAITHGGATNGALPGILAGSYLSNAYDADGRVDITSLPRKLGEAGYNTAGIGASNPFLGKWADHFDYFWNDGMGSPDTSTNRNNYSTFSKALGFGRLQSRVTAKELTERGKQWWESTNPPRFLWLHFMDLHAPYYPGITGGLQEGLARTYKSILQHARGEFQPNALKPSTQRHLQKLYWKCVSNLDGPLSDLLQYFDEDTVLAITGDHGEELYHGLIGHARLYDESICVPLIYRGPDFDTSSSVQLMNLAPKLLNLEGLTTPDSWNGVASSEQSEIAISSQFAPAYGYTMISARSRNRKVIEYFDHDSEDHCRTERYNLVSDPYELHPIQNSENFSHLRKKAREHISRHKVLTNQDIAYETGLNDDVDDRLQQLGYKN